jgi:hypothetical protein
VSSDPFVDLADSLDGFVAALRGTMNRHRLPLEGSPVLVEAAGEPFAGEWGARPSAEIFGPVYLTAWACADHLAALAAVLRAGRGVAASYTLARGACEAAATGCYLTDQRVDGRERIRRSFNNHLTALSEQIRLLTPLSPPEAAGVAQARQRVAVICSEGARQGFRAGKMDDRKAACLDKAMPGAMQLVGLCASSDPGFGSASYRALSAVAHGQMHGLSRFLMPSLPGPGLDPAAAPGQINVNARELARKLAVAPMCAAAMAHGVWWFAGWDGEDIEHASRLMYHTWARVSGVRYAAGSP